MNRKSKFVVFLLSFIPGLSHFYLGVTIRGVIFMAAAAANIAVAVVINIAYWHAPIILLGLPVIWFIALIDSLMLADKINTEYIKQADNNNPAESIYTGEEIKVQNQKVLTCIFSIVPGAGHMYLGYQKQGLELMTIFFFSFFFIDWLRISLFMFIIPVIWFYSMFDALGKVSNDISARGEKFQVSLFDLVSSHSLNFTGSKLLGYGLLGIGLLLIFDRIISPLITYEIKNYLQTGLVSCLFIYGGIRILMGNKKPKEQEAEAECESKE